MELVNIQNAATAESALIQLHPSDNVAIVRMAFGGIPAGHKVAVRDITAGGDVVRYGCVIGRATRAIASGEHVHTHNVVLPKPVDLDADAFGRPIENRLPVGNLPHFFGYPRKDGRAGTRNYIAVAAASNCASHAAELLAARFPAGSLPEGVDGVVAFPHGEGCGHSIGPDTQQLQRVISGVLDHPNVAGAVLVGLGCEVNRIENYFPAHTRNTERLAGLTLQSSGGTRAVVQEGMREVKRLIGLAEAEKRAPVPASKIVLGLNCGGSDSFSGISANPALGVCSDLLARFGATAVLAETPEIFGAEHLLLRRAVSAQVAEKLLACVRDYKRYLSQFGAAFDDNPSPGNKEGGLTNIVEKSLGAVAKGGASPLCDVVGYGERIQNRGLVFMNTPGYDPVSLTGLAAGGVNLIAFTTGRGSAIGFPTVPVIKISTNTSLYQSMRDNMDLNAGRIVDGETSVDQAGCEILVLVLAVASGRRTSSEALGHREFVPWRIGPVL